MHRAAFVVCRSIDPAKVHLAIHLSKSFSQVIRQIPRNKSVHPIRYRNLSHARALHRSFAFPPSPFTHQGASRRSLWVLASSRQGAFPQSRGLSSQPWWTYVSTCRTHVSSKAPPFQCLHSPYETIHSSTQAIHPVPSAIPLAAMMCEG